jgi:hypothetical protein
VLRAEIVYPNGQSFDIAIPAEAANMCRAYDYVVGLLELGLLTLDDGSQVFKSNVTEFDFIRVYKDETLEPEDRPRPFEKLKDCTCIQPERYDITLEVLGNPIRIYGLIEWKPDVIYYLPYLSDNGDITKIVSWAVLYDALRAYLTENIDGAEEPIILHPIAEMGLVEAIEYLDDFIKACEREKPYKPAEKTAKAFFPEGEE